MEENEGKQLASQWACVGYSEVSALTGPLFSSKFLLSLFSLFNSEFPGVGLKSAVSELCQEIIQQHMYAFIFL